MKPPLVVDASVVMKWLVPEKDSAAALVLREHYRFIAPQLLFAECANILWKKAGRRELTTEQAIEAAELIESLEVEAVSMRELVATATAFAIRFDHPAYDFFYLALAILEDCFFITADAKLYRKVSRSQEHRYCMLLGDLAA